MSTQPSAAFLRLNDPAILRQIGIAVGMTEGERDAFVASATVIGQRGVTRQKTPRQRKVPGGVQSEKDLQDECETWLREHSGIPAKWIRPRMDKRSGLPVGWVDFTILTTNRFGSPVVCLIECKRADIPTLDPEQERVAAELAAVGHVVHVARSLAEFREAIRAEIER